MIVVGQAIVQGSGKAIAQNGIGAGDVFTQPYERRVVGRHGPRHDLVFKERQNIICGHAALSQ